MGFLSASKVCQSVVNSLPKLCSALIRSISPKTITATNLSCLNTVLCALMLQNQMGESYSESIPRLIEKSQ